MQGRPEVRVVGRQYRGSGIKFGVESQITVDGDQLHFGEAAGLEKDHGRQGARELFDMPPLFVWNDWSAKGYVDSRE